MIMHLFISISDSCEPNYDICAYSPCFLVCNFLNNISNNLFGADPDSYEVEEKETYDYQLICYDKDSLSLFQLPHDIILIITRMLPPPDVVNLSKTHSDFHFIINDEFWKLYNSFHSYKTWNLQLPEIKITYGYFWYKKNEITKSALLGHPEAVKRVQQNRKAHHHTQRHYKERPYDTHAITTKYDILRRKFSTPQLQY